MLAMGKIFNPEIFKAWNNMNNTFHDIKIKAYLQYTYQSFHPASQELAYWLEKLISTA
jgi:hypothetical protein